MRRKTDSRAGQRWIAGAAAGVVAAVGLPHAAVLAAPSKIACRLPFASSSVNFYTDTVLGAPMELWVRAPDRAQADECHRQVMWEIRRLNGLLSTYDPGSEISQVMRGAAVQSPGLAELLEQYAFWQARTNGAINLNLGAVKGLWSSADGTDHLPEMSSLRQAASLERAYNVDALGKGYIIDRAVERARAIAPSGLLNIGGDLRAWGDDAWPIGIANPVNYADNAAPLAVFALRNSAVATSGGYARYATIAGHRYSHIIDPRTLWPVAYQGRSSTAVARNCLTANAVSTAMQVLGDQGGSALAREHADGFLSVENGAARRGGSLGPVPILAPQAIPQATTRPTTRSATSKPSPKPWPTNFQMRIDVATHGGGTRPYVAVWIEEDRGKLVRDVTVWGKLPYLRELTDWWKETEDCREQALSLSVATRIPGRYTLTWDGRNDAGVMMPQAKYRVVLEISREHGRHITEWAEIVCGSQAVSGTLRATAESDASTIHYGPKDPN